MATDVLAADGLTGASLERRAPTIGTFVVALFYLCVLGWLIVCVAVPAVGFGLDPVVITSGSMQPGIRAGDVVMLAHPEDVDHIAPGTVVAFRDPTRPGGLITHRVTGMTPAGDYRTRGDANADADSTPVPADDVVGVAHLLVPIIGTPVVWLEQNTGLFVLWGLITVAACVIASRPPNDEAGPTASGDVA
ncbi:Signal peptidase I [Euzebya pacifica]|uniref:Signal peptidase I n=1 Tax=Euzebya pacifica TaxID=1608957 RepID=A0A346XS85_9ACTN|nr:signal peptidase I [Euzebya pacifica]AXV05082.1 Signal peptidase I [Euzebya pacifica]